jgi:hypothetical protein
MITDRAHKNAVRRLERDNRLLKIMVVMLALALFVWVMRG